MRSVLKNVVDICIESNFNPYQLSTPAGYGWIPGSFGRSWDILLYHISTQLIEIIYQPLLQQKLISKKSYSQTKIENLFDSELRIPLEAVNY